MLSVKNNRRIVRTSAGYDLIATASFMRPWTASATFQGFAALSGILNLDRPVPILDVNAMLFANLLGSIVIVWSLWRLTHASRSVGLYGRWRPNTVRTLARLCSGPWCEFLGAWVHVV